MWKAKQLEVVSADGEGIGTLRGVYVTPDRHVPKIAMVGLRHAGRASRRELPIPLAGARCTGRTLKLAFSSAEIRLLALDRLTDDESGERLAVYGDLLITPEHLRGARLARQRVERSAPPRVVPWAHARFDVRVVWDEDGLGWQQLVVRRTARVPPDDEPPKSLGSGWVGSTFLYREVEGDGEGS